MSPQPAHLQTSICRQEGRDQPKAQTHKTKEKALTKFLPRLLRAFIIVCAKFMKLFIPGGIRHAPDRDRVPPAQKLCTNRVRECERREIRACRWCARARFRRAQEKSQNHLRKRLGQRSEAHAGEFHLG